MSSIKEALEQSLSAWDKYDPYVSRESIVRKANTMAEAIRAALATFQPDGEKKEAIARALAEKWPGDYMQGDDECEREPNALAYETADAILASSLVQENKK